MQVMIGNVALSMPPRERLSFKNPRRIAVIGIPGAPPVLQDMGEEETTMSWNGSLVGPSAYRDAISIESSKDEGREIRLSLPGFPELNKTVRIKTFDWELVRKDRVDYTVELLAVIPPPDVTPPPTESASPVSGGVATPASKALASTPQESDQAQEYSVASGDTLWAIAEQTLGDGSRWTEIAAANGIDDPRTLQAGASLVIPA